MVPYLNLFCLMKKLIVSFAVFVIVLWLTAAGILEKEDTKLAATITSPNKLTDISITTIKGQLKPLSAFASQGVLVLNYFSTSCEFCEAEFTALIEFSRTFQ